MELPNFNLETEKKNTYNHILPRFATLHTSKQVENSNAR